MVGAVATTFTPRMRFTLVVEDVPVTSPEKVEAVPNLLLNIVKSAAVKYPGIEGVAAAIDTTGAVVPVTTTGAVPVTPVTVPVVGVDHDKMPAVSDVKTCPFEAAAVAGKVIV